MTPNGGGSIADMTEPECRCPTITILGEAAGQNWSEQCPAHGFGTEWYHQKLRDDPKWRRWSFPPKSELRAAGIK